MLKFVRIFKNLNIPANLEQAKASLKGISGIYCIRHIASGKIYFGQTLDLSVRIIQHLNGISSNIILQWALKKYGLAAFEFIVVEFVEDTSLLTTREQVHLDWLFSLSKNLRYNICPTAESRLGTTHTPEAKSAIGAALIGNTNSVGNTNCVGRILSAESIDLIRLNNPNRMSIFCYEHDTRKLVGEYLSQRDAAKSLKISPRTLRRYLANEEVLNNKFIIRSSPLS